LAGSALRTKSVYLALEKISRQAERCEERAASWKKEFGEEDFIRRAELVRAEAMHDVVERLKEELNL